MKITRAVIEDSVGRQPDLNALIANVQAKPVGELETAEGLAKRMQVLEESAAEPPSFALERIIGHNDLLPFSYLENGMRVGNAVARLLINDAAGRPLSKATGFMISERLLLTNHHVIPSADLASGSIAEFNFQFAPDGRSVAGVNFQLAPEDFFYTHPKLDFSLVAVKSMDVTGTTAVGSYGYISLNPQKGKITTGEYVSIIQHPDGEEKKIAIRENQVLDHTSSNDFIWYRTDTSPGSSGAPVFNDQWQLVALHHSGVPADDGAGNYLTTDGRKIKPTDIDTIDSDDIQWKANEGIRVSIIVETLRIECADQPLVDELLSLKLNCDIRQSTEAMVDKTPSDTQPANHTLMKDDSLQTTTRGGSVSITIPLQITVSLGNAGDPIAATGVQTAEAPAETSPSAEEAVIVIDQHYGNRKGFDEDFLGQKVGLPKLSADQQKLAAKLVGTNDYVLNYYHFSIIVNKDRKMPFFTAVNIDGAQFNKIKSQIPSRKTIGTDKWFIDPRIEPDPDKPQFQIPAKFYAGNDFDIGHQVRREDPVWGTTAAFAIKCNNDTFHLTNACPQHKNFNQGIPDPDNPKYKDVTGKILWQGLENYILDNARANNLRVNVYTGPVLDPKDKPYHDTGILIPKAFWKVVAMKQANGHLSATGYLVSQKDLISAMEEFTFGKFLFYQVPIRQLEKLTGLSFNLSKYDPLDHHPMSTQESLSVNEAEDMLHPITDLSQIQWGKKTLEAAEANFEYTITTNGCAVQQLTINGTIIDDPGASGKAVVSVHTNQIYYMLDATQLQPMGTGTLQLKYLPAKKDVLNPATDFSFTDGTGIGGIKLTTVNLPTP